MGNCVCAGRGVGVGFFSWCGGVVGDGVGVLSDGRDGVNAECGVDGDVSGVAIVVDLDLAGVVEGSLEWVGGVCEVRGQAWELVE